MPVFPVMAAVTDPELGLDSLGAHLLVEQHVLVKKMVFVSAIYEPFDAAEFFHGLCICVVYKSKGGVLPYAAV